MKSSLRHVALSLAASVSLACMAVPAAADALCGGGKVRLISPHGSGVSDLMARVMAEGLSQRLGQVVYVEPVTGAGGAIGIRELAGAAPDGCTLGIVGLSTMVIAPLVDKAEKLGYTPAKDFTFVGMVGGSPAAFAVNAGLGIKTFAELSDSMLKDGRSLTYATPGPTTITAILPRTLFGRVGGESVIVPYTESGEALVAAAEGHVDAVSLSVSTMSPQVEAGALVPLFVSSPERLAEWPEVPTLAELGHAELATLIWFGLGAPAGMDAATTRALNEAMNAVLADPKAVAPLTAAGVSITPMTPEAMAAQITDQSRVLGAAVATMDLP